MSHYCLLVIGDHPESQIAKYDENLKLPMHKVASKEQLIARCRKSNEDYKNGLYAEFLKDPESYKARCHNDDHIKYLEEAFPKKLEWTDQQCYDYEISDYIGQDWCEVHSDGSLWMTTNQEAKWDYYLTGGRWRGLLKLKTPDDSHPLYDGWQFADTDKGEYERLRKEGRCDQALVGEICNLDQIKTFAIVKEGEWHERGSMGWWGCVSDEKDKYVWDEETKKLLEGLSDDTLLTVFDCHI